MAEVKKARLFLRRGTDTDRINTILCEGELGYSTDAFRVVVGDGTTDGGRSLGATVFVSAGADYANSHTNLTTASANGIALSGDFAVFAAASYVNGNGVTVNPTTTTGTSATTVMLLTGSDASVAGSWVAVNSGIPWGNIDTPVDSISGEQIHGGDISGDVTFSGTISTTSLTSTSAFIGGLQGTGNRAVIVTSTGQLTAAAADVASGNDLADGKLRFLDTSKIISSAAVAYKTDWTVSLGSSWSAVPTNATVALLQFVWMSPGAHGPVSSKNKKHLLEVRAGTGTTTLTGAHTNWASGNQHWAHPNYGGSNQFYCPLSAAAAGVSFQFRMRVESEIGAGGTAVTSTVFAAGHHLTLLGYM